MSELDKELELNKDNFEQFFKELNKYHQVLGGFKCDSFTTNYCVISFNKHIFKMHYANGLLTVMIENHSLGNNKTELNKYLLTDTRTHKGWRKFFNVINDYFGLTTKKGL